MKTKQKLVVTSDPRVFFDCIPFTLHLLFNITSYANSFLFPRLFSKLPEGKYKKPIEYADGTLFGIKLSYIFFTFLTSQPQQT